ncbi:MAG: serine hydrolase [bacterium]|nr:serine hydrolase [bacterium]
MNRKPLLNKPAFLIFLLFALSSLPFAQGSSTRIDKGSLPGKVDRLMARFVQAGTPGAAIMIIQKDKVLFEKGYGLANLETKVPIKPDTAFLLASVTKQFTAMAIMILEEQGKLRYDDPLAKFFPQFPPYAQNMTIRHLLNHTAGLTEYETIYLNTGKVGKNWPRSSKGKPDEFEPSAKDVLALLGKQEELRFKPGDKYEYSNSGYVILGQIVEKVSGKSCARFFHQYIFKPLEMKNSLLYDRASPKIKNPATSYTLEFGSYKDIDYTPFNFVYGEDNVYSTITDMYKWDHALYTEKLVKASTIKKAFTPGKLNDGSFTSYGFGWMLSTSEGRKVVSHSGSWVGFRTYIMRDIEDKNTFIIFSNVSHIPVTRIANALRDILHGREYTLPKISIVRAIGQTILQYGIDAAIKQYRQLKKKQSHLYSFRVRELNTLGYQLLGINKVKDAVKIFKLNAAVYPQDSNVYDSLGEAYMKDGNKELAIKNYKKSLQLNPNNRNAVDMLKKLKQSGKKP